ncbi:MAG: response regulator [Bdellovibrionales bacterium]|nr:response regulator [Bdellovibrionales bacterium]
MDQIRTLVIEDSPGDFALTQNCLAKVCDSSDGEFIGRKILVDWAQTIKEAKEKSQQNDFKLVLLDLNLPDASGIDSIDKVISIFPDCPIVILSGLSDAKLSIEVVRAGAQDYLIKNELNPLNVGRSIRYAIERFELVRELKQKNADLEAFTAVATHDLKSPLYKISEASELLLEGNIHDEEQKNMFLEMIRRGARRLGQLIDDLLMLSRIGHEAVEFSNVDLNQLFDDVVESLDTLILKESAKVTRDDLPTLFGCRSGLTIIFQNLISNSLKYRSERDPLIKVSSQQENKVWKIIFSDNGMGIDQQEINNIFQPFVRGSGSYGTEGSGIGLATCSRLAELHYGNITAESIIGEGTNIILSLPSQKILNVGKNRNLTKISTISTNSHAKILLVDDDQLQTKIISNVLKKVGFDVVAFTEAKEALEAIKQHDFDCIISDLIMPGVSGEELLVQIKSESDLPVIIYTGMAQSAKDRVLSLGAADCVQKGDAAKKLLESIFLQLNISP